MSEFEIDTGIHAEVRPIPGLAGYFASSDGFIYSTRRGGLLRKLMPCTHRGYFFLTVDGKIERVHHLIAITFLGPRPTMSDGKPAVIRHLDSNPKNNLCTNLRYGTQAENLADRIGAGTMPWGERHGRAKLKEADIIEIRERRSAGESCRRLAAEYGVGHQAVHRIGLGQRWAHISDQK